MSEFIYSYPRKRTGKRNVNQLWNQYISILLSLRGNWKYIDYSGINDSTKLNVIYSPTAKFNKNSSINGNMYNTAKVLGNKNLLLQALIENNAGDYIPNSIFIKSSDIIDNTGNLQSFIHSIYKPPKTFYYLKYGMGSNSRTVFIVKTVDEIVKVITNFLNSSDQRVTSDWILSENVDSYLFKRKGKYSGGGITFNEKSGHKGQFKFMVLFCNDPNSKNVYLYNKSCYALAPHEFTGDYSSIPQNMVTGLGERSNLKTFVPETYPDYDLDSDYGFTGEQVFGEKYHTVIVPQVINITKDIFKILHGSLNCKNDFYYNDSFKSCFQVCSVDIIVDPQMKCYLLEVNTRPDMVYKKYDDLLDFNGLAEGLIRICVDPYFTPKQLPEVQGETNGLIKENPWHRLAFTHRETNYNTFYTGNTFILSSEMKNLYSMRSNWQQIIYPKDLLDKYHIDFVGKRSMKAKNGELYVNDPIMNNGILINKIATLNHYLGNKKIMYDILSNDPRSFKFLPLTATFNISEQNWEQLIKYAMSYTPRIKTWILKPAMGLQGKDIMISNNQSEVIEYIKKNDYSEWVLSQYLDNPFLLKLTGNAKSGFKFNDTIGRKTHIRIYVLITKINSETHIYLYEDNLIFCAVKEYSFSDLKDPFSNLTNLNLGSIYYEQNGLNGKDAYKDLSYPVKHVVNEIFGQKFYDQVVFPQLKNILEIVLDNSMDYLKCVNYSNKQTRGCFQYIAFDVMPDRDFNLHLLEINGRPGMNAPKYHWKSLKNFANSLLNKTSDVLFKNKKNPVSKKGFILIK